MTPTSIILKYAKEFSGLTPDLEDCLKEVSPEITPYLRTITDSFYKNLILIPNAAKFLEGRIDKLKDLHVNWLKGLFTMPIDADFAESLSKVGDTHFKICLPMEFMVGAMALLNNEFTLLVFEKFGENPNKCSKLLRAINSICALSLMLMLMRMEQNYRRTAVAEELEKFLKISGMSRTLFSNLSKAYD